MTETKREITDAHVGLCRSSILGFNNYRLKILERSFEGAEAYRGNSTTTDPHSIGISAENIIEHIHTAKEVAAYLNPVDDDGHIRRVRSFALAFNATSEWDIRNIPQWLTRLFSMKKNLGYQTIHINSFIYCRPTVYAVIHLGSEMKNTQSLRRVHRRMLDFVQDAELDKSLNINHSSLLSEELDKIFGVPPTDLFENPPRLIRDRSGIDAAIPLVSKLNGMTRAKDIGCMAYTKSGPANNFQIIEQVVARHFDEISEPLIRNYVELYMGRNNPAQEESDSPNINPEDFDLITEDMV